MTAPQTREAWLIELAARIAPWYSAPVPPVRLSVGFTSKGGRSTRVGECWSPECDPDGACHIFLHPSLTNSLAIAGVLVHELVHAVVGHDAGHGPAFKAEAQALGLEGRMTATTVGEELAARLREVLDAIGPCPHGTLTTAAGKASTPKKQTTRMLKVVCPECGYVVRTTQKWLDVGAPICGPCSDPVSGDFILMEPEGAGE